MGSVSRQNRGEGVQRLLCAQHQASSSPVFGSERFKNTVGLLGGKSKHRNSNTEGAVDAKSALMGQHGGS